MFVDPGVKVNGEYYRDVLLSQQMIRAIKQVAGGMFVFQQDSAPAHHARDTIQLLQRETPDFIGPDLWPSNSPDLNPVDYKIWGVMQQRVYESCVNNVDKLKQRPHDVWHGAAGHHWLGCQPVETVTESVRACTRETFWTFVLSLCNTNLRWKPIRANKLLLNFVY